MNACAVRGLQEKPGGVMFSTFPSTNLIPGTFRRLLPAALCALAGSGIMSNAQGEETMPEGMLGWWYYVGYLQHGYASNPVEACNKTARNHMGTPLLDMRPSNDGGLAFDCKYHHVMKPG